VFGHKWEPAQGTIVESAIEQRAVEGQHGLHEVRVYTVDIRQSGGRHQRVSLPVPPNLHGELRPAPPSGRRCTRSRARSGSIPTTSPSG
jgi:hypothetical protein